MNLLKIVNALRYALCYLSQKYDQIDCDCVNKDRFRKKWISGTWVDGLEFDTMRQRGLEENSRLGKGISLIPVAIGSSILCEMNAKFE